MLDCKNGGLFLWLPLQVIPQQLEYPERHLKYPRGARNFDNPFPSVAPDLVLFLKEAGLLGPRTYCRSAVYVLTDEAMLLGVVSFGAEAL